MFKKLIPVLFMALYGFAGNAQDPALTLSLKQALQMGMDSSKTLKISQARMQLAETKYNQAVDATIPSVRFSAGYTRLSDIDEPKFLFPGSTVPVALFPVYVNNYSSAISVSETIFSGFRLKYAKESQKLLRDAAKYENENNKTATAFTIINAYFNLFKLGESAKALEEDLKQVNEQLRESTLAQKSGLAVKTDVLRWQLEVSNLELSLMDVRNNISIANYNFCLMLGMNENTRILPDSAEANASFPVKAFNDYLAAAIDKRSDLAASGLQTKASKNALMVARNSYLPKISLNGEFLDARPNQRYIPPVDQFHTTWAAGIALSWDLVSLYSNRHTVDEAQSLYRQSMENTNLIADEVKSEINQNFLLLNETVQKGEVMKKTVELAEENYRLMNARYKNSLVLMSDLLEANTRMLNARINYSLTKADIQIAYYRLLKSTGSIN